MKRITRLVLALALLAAPANAALEKTWYTSPNNALDSSSLTNVSKNALWQMYAALTGVPSAWTNNANTVPATGLWTVWCSSDGSGIAGGGHLPTDDCTTSHNDAWTTTYTPANLVRATAGSNHSWMVLKSANTGGYPTIYMLIDWSTTTDQTVTLSWSLGVMKCAANPCTATTAPTSADKWSLTTAYTTNVASIASQNRLHYSMDQDGSFWFQATRDGNGWGQINPLVGIWIKDFKAADPVPFVTSDAYPAVSSNNNAGVGHWGEDAHAGGLTGMYSRTYTNGSTATIVTLGIGLWHKTSSGFGMIMSDSQTPNITGTDGIDGKWDDLPMYLFDITSPGLKGRLPDFRQAPYTIVTGSVAPSPGPFTNIAYSGTLNGLSGAWFPYVNASTPIF